MEFKSSLVVVDTLFDMVDTLDVNSYAPIKKQLSFFNNLAEKSGSHIMFIHHQNKPNLNYGRGSGHTVLGSTAIFGSVDCLLIFEQAEQGLRKLAAQGRAIGDFGVIYLKFDKQKMSYELTQRPDEFT
jgi:RecA-family ATPase